MKKKIIVPILCILCLAVMSCQSLLDKVTPCDIPKPARDYAGVDPNQARGPLGYPTLYNARQIETAVETTHHHAQINFMRQVQDDNYKYQIALDLIRPPIAESQQLQDRIIGSPEQPLSILGVLGASGLTYWIGAKRKRPGDLDPDQAEAEKVRAREEGRQEERGKNV